jgi:hypothetical protein
MVGMMLSSLTRYYDEYKADARIIPAVQKQLDYLWANEWNATSQGFRYCSNVQDNCTTEPEPGLNGLILPAWGWYWQKTSNPTYRDRADQVANGNLQNKVNWLGFAQQFDQAYYRAGNYFARRGN